MIDFNKVSKGDILKIIGDGAPGYAKIGELVRVIETHPHRVVVEKKDGQRATFYNTCGAARLEPTKWKGEFPEAFMRG